jgi:hypothetical protein
MLVEWVLLVASEGVRNLDALVLNQHAVRSELAYRFLLLGYIMMSVVILTNNEERDQSGCLSSVRWSDNAFIIMGVWRAFLDERAGVACYFLHRTFEFLIVSKKRALATAHEIGY